MDDIQAKIGLAPHKRFLQLTTDTEDKMQGIRSRSGSCFVRLADDVGVVQAEGFVLRRKSSKQRNLFPSAAVRTSRTTLDAEISKLESEIEGLHRLRGDMRENIAAVVCSRMRQAAMQRRPGCADGWEWGEMVLTRLVSTDFSKRILKELRKSSGQDNLLP